MLSKDVIKIVIAVDLWNILFEVVVNQSVKNNLNRSKLDFLKFVVQCEL